MTRTTLAVLAVGLLLGADTTKDDPAAKDVEKAITTLNEAFQKRDAEAIKPLLTEDHVAVTVYYGGPQAVRDQLASLPDLKLTEYAAGKLQVTLLGKDAALVTYELAMNGTFKGKEVPRKSYASAVWVNRGGKWLELHYQQTPLEGK
jgi:uncharacterized protein (TIGR02246 family)